jgi:hypothetical protein
MSTPCVQFHRAYPQWLLEPQWRDPPFPNPISDRYRAFHRQWEAYNLEVDADQNCREYQLDLLNKYWGQRAERRARLGKKNPKSGNADTAKDELELWKELHDGHVASLRRDLQMMAEQLRDLQIDLRAVLVVQDEQAEAAEELATAHARCGSTVAHLEAAVAEHGSQLAQLTILSTERLRP